MNFNLITAVIAKVKARNPEVIRREKMKTLFQVDNQVRNRKTGIEYRVYEVDCGGASLLDAKGNVLMASWISYGGSVRSDIADRWDLVPARV